MSGSDGWRLLGILFPIPLVQLIYARSMGRDALLSLYGISFIAMALNGHSMWYLFAYPIGFFLLISGVLLSNILIKNKFKITFVSIFLTLLTYHLFHYSFRSNEQFDPMLPSVKTFSRSFLPKNEIVTVKKFILSLPAGTTVSFGNSGVEPYFFSEFAKSGARWTISAKNVIQVYPARTYDYRVLCDSAMYPRYLSIFDWDGYPRKSLDTGCKIFKVSK